MEIEVLKDGITGMGPDGDLYDIKGIKIIVQDAPNRFYDINTSFYKACCPSGTKHSGKEVKPGVVELI